MNRIVIVSGPPGAGKSTVARRLAQASPSALAMHMHTDDFYAYIRKGFVPPWKPEAMHQNITLMQAMAAAAATCAAEGYDVFVDGIVGPWFFDPWRAAAVREGLDVRYIALVPDEDEAVRRGVARTEPGAMIDEAVIRQMWRAFQEFPPPAANVVDTTFEDAGVSAGNIARRLGEGEFRLA